MASRKNPNKINPLNPKNSGKSDGKGPNQPKKFNFYWIYVIILCIILGLQLFSGMNTNLQKTDWQTFENEYLKQDEVEKLVLVKSNEINTVHVYIKP